MRPMSLVFAAVLLLAFGALAQGPIQPPRAQDGKPVPAASASEALPVPVEEIIRQFAAKEAEFKDARDHYTYTQYVRVQEFDNFGRPGGEYVTTSEVIFTPEGKRYERITYAPPSTLHWVSLSPEDEKDLANIQPFVLTTEDLPKYNLQYQGREQVDEIGTYVFSVTPKRIEKGQRYFEGRIWVDDRDLQIVKTYGKAVPDIRHGKQENLFPMFETYRETIDGKYWFPTYTRANDTLRFSNGDIRIHMIVRYTDYKKFTVSTRIIGVEPPKPDQSKPPQPPN